MKLKRISAIFLVCLLAISTAACSGSKEGDKSEAVVQAINVSIESEPDSLDQAKASDWSAFIATSQMVEGLTAVIAENGKEIVEPAMAESWDVSQDKLTWTFHIRDAKWADGQPVTAGDFEYGIKRVLDPKTASPNSSNVKFIKNGMDIIAGKKPVEEAGIKAIDEKTLEIVLDYPVPYLLEIAAGTTMHPVRADIIEKYGDSYGTEADKTLACGAFILDEWVHNSKLTYSKNPNYWNAENVKLESLTIKIIEDEATLVGEFENDQLDSIQVYSSEWIEKLSQGDKYAKKVLQFPETIYLFFNQENKVFSNADVRKAFSIAMNREEIGKDFYQDLVQPAYGWLPPVLFLDGEDFRAKAGDPIKDLIGENPDPKALLSKGLKALGMNEDPTQLNLKLMCPDYDKDFAEYLQQSFKASLGVNIEIDSAQWPVFQERNRNLDYEFGFKSYYASYNDPSVMMNLWITGTKTIPTGWSNPEYDRLVNGANQSIDKDVRFNNFKEAERLLVYQDATIAPYGYASAASFSKKNVMNIIEPSYTVTLYKYAYIE